MSDAAPREHAFLSRSLVRVGARASDNTIRRLNRCLNYLEAGRWMRRHGYSLDDPAADRYELFRRAAREIADKQVLYIEFGVAHGVSMRFWCDLLRNPLSKLHGFDSFEGLPTAWSLGGGQEAGAFSVGGQVPDLGDPRTKFFKGWFAETLPHYEFPEHEQLVVNIDADVYSSAVTVLDAVEAHLRPGSLLYFDEFNHRADEMRAFDEFRERTQMEFELVGATPQLLAVCFRRV
jgi:hypothetical protein